MTRFIQEAAERDILNQVAWYAERGLFDIAERFSEATVSAIDALTRMPEAGAPRAVSNPQLAGLRTWPVKGFDEFRMVRPTLLTVVRVLHSKRNTDAILENQDTEAPGKH